MNMIERGRNKQNVSAANLTATQPLCTWFVELQHAHKWEAAPQTNRRL